jgi:hypothetical protein
MDAPGQEEAAAAPRAVEEGHRADAVSPVAAPRGIREEGEAVGGL